MKTTEQQGPTPQGVGSNDLFGVTAPERGAVLSHCRRYRYTLWRRWADGQACMFVGLNPSTADAELDDPTIRRCVAYSRAWGFGGLVMTNLFAWRATDPRDMMAAADPVGEDNDYWLQAASIECGLTVAAWGAGGAYLGRGVDVRRMLRSPHYLRLTKDGHPGHPLYLPASLRPVEWVTPNAAGKAPPSGGRP